MVQPRRYLLPGEEIRGQNQNEAPTIQLGQTKGGLLFSNAFRRPVDQLGHIVHALRWHLFFRFAESGRDFSLGFGRVRPPCHHSFWIAVFPLPVPSLHLRKGPEEKTENCKNLAIGIPPCYATDLSDFPLRLL